MMLADLASIRGGGRTLMLFTDSPVGQVPDDAKRPKPYMQQIMDAMPEMFHGGILDPDAENLTCGDCENFYPQGGRCQLRLFLVKASDRACDYFDARLDDK